MTIATPSPTPPKLLTYEEYLAEGEINLRYDIVEGVRIFMPGPIWRHQRISDKITRLFLNFEETSGIGQALSSPFDVLIRAAPRLQVRQPDVLFISNAALARSGGVPASGPLLTAPELIVEILSDSDRERVIADKLADYSAIGVQEAWLVRPTTRTIEVLRLTPNGPIPVATYDETQAAQSFPFPGLTITVADIFR